MGLWSAPLERSRYLIRFSRSLNTLPNVGHPRPKGSVRLSARGVLPADAAIAFLDKIAEMNQFGDGGEVAANFCDGVADI